jgi:hypothetical protein
LQTTCSNWKTFFASQNEKEIKIMSLDLRKGDVVVLKENSLFWNRYKRPGNGPEEYESVLFGVTPMKVSHIYDWPETHILLRSNCAHDVLVPISLIAKRIGSVHDWFGLCDHCHSLSKGGTECWKCNTAVVEPNCITWSNVKMLPRQLQRGGIDPVMYLRLYDYSDEYPDSFQHIDIQESTDYEYLDWLQYSTWRPQAVNDWMKEIVRVLRVIGLKTITPTMMSNLGDGFLSNNHTFRQSRSVNFALNDDFQAVQSIQDDEITTALTYNSEDDVQNLQRHDDRFPILRYNYSDRGPDTIEDWYKEIGWIFAAVGGSDINRLLHHLDYLISPIDE